MAGILAALKGKRIECYAPAGAVEGGATDVVLPDLRAKRLGKFIEIPAPEGTHLHVPPIADDDPLFFRYFIDGSERVTNAGHVVDPKGRYLPLLIAQIAVATTTLHGGRLRLENYVSDNLLFFPASFGDDRLRAAEVAVREAAATSRSPMALGFEQYEVDDGDRRSPVDRARAQILQKMHEMEVKQIESLAANRKVGADALLLIDGSIEFYTDMEEHMAAFANVVGVAKSFDLHRMYGTGKNAMQVGKLIAGLPVGYRTPARRTGHRNLSIASWYLRLQGRSRVPSLSYADGAVKIEVFPPDPRASSPTIPEAKCARISQHVFALRAPATPYTDARWASHLYPIYLTERYIKTRFRDEHTIRA
ncbi:MAG: hypothetical protein F4X20_02495 [Dehalococcoidia bacterium]|nr:hypothetical protein [Dehalococcoidia bacterium]